MIARVTEILKPFSSYEKVPTHILERACEKGTAVHALCEAIAKGSWVPESLIDDAYKGYVRSFMQWKEKNMRRVVICEERYTDEVLQYSGQIDFVIEGFDEFLYLVDLKTTYRVEKTHAIQLAAYKRLLDKHDINVRASMVVYLDKTGEEPLVQYFEDLDKQTSVFISAVTCHHYFYPSKK